MVQEVKLLVAKLDGLSLILGTKMVEAENHLLRDAL